MCEVTGGKAMTATSVTDLRRCFEAINMLMQPFVCLSFLPQSPAQATSETSAATGAASIGPAFDKAANPTPGDAENGAPATQSAVPAVVSAPESTAASGAPPSYDPPPKVSHHGVHVKLSNIGRFMGIWPLPESYHPSRVENLVPRDAHPRIILGVKPTEPIVVEGLPFDKYELEGSTLTSWILGKKKTSLCWPCYMPKRLGKTVKGRSGSKRDMFASVSLRPFWPTHAPLLINPSSGTGDLGRPFGYLKPSTAGDAVNLLVMPYDYPTLSVLMHQVRGWALLAFARLTDPRPLTSLIIPTCQLAKVHRNKPPQTWIAQFRKYLASIPPYYYPVLRNTMRSKFGAAVRYLNDVESMLLFQF
jgi:integrator complex subunit 6